MWTHVLLFLHHDLLYLSTTSQIWETWYILKPRWSTNFRGKLAIIEYNKPAGDALRMVFRRWFYVALDYDSQSLALSKRARDLKSLGDTMFLFKWISTDFGIHEPDGFWSVKCIIPLVFQSRIFSTNFTNIIFYEYIYQEQHFFKTFTLLYSTNSHKQFPTSTSFESANPFAMRVLPVNSFYYCFMIFVCEKQLAFVYNSILNFDVALSKLYMMFNLTIFCVVTLQSWFLES